VTGVRRRALALGFAVGLGLGLLAACQPTAGTGSDRPGGAGPDGTSSTSPGHPDAAAPAAGPGPDRRIDLAAEPWALLADRGGLWVVLGDRSLARLDPATGRVDGAPVALPFTPGSITAGHGALWVAGQVEGRRRVTAEGSYPVIRLARVDPERRRVRAVIALPMRSNGNRLASTPTAVWVTDPAEGTSSRTWRVDPAGNRLLSPPLRAGEEPLAIETSGGSVWSANHDDGTLRRLDAATGRLLATIELGVEPHAMAVAPDAIWVADAHHHAVLRVDPSGGSVLARIPVGFEAGLLAAAGGAVWAATRPHPDYPAGIAARIDPAANRVTATLRLAGQATALAADRDRVWAATSNPHAVLRLPA
jgi:hypothetical protein